MPGRGGVPARVVTPLTDTCDQECEARLQAAEIVAKANYAVADAITAATERFAPAADVLAGVGDRMDHLCQFLRKRGPWLLASTPLVLTSIGAITPEAGKLLHHALAAGGIS